MSDRNAIIETQRIELVSIRSEIEGVNDADREQLAIENQRLSEEVAGKKKEIQLYEESLAKVRSEYVTLGKNVKRDEVY